MNKQNNDGRTMNLDSANYVDTNEKLRKKYILLTIWQAIVITNSHKWSHIILSSKKWRKVLECIVFSSLL